MPLRTHINSFLTRFASPTWTGFFGLLAVLSAIVSFYFGVCAFRDARAQVASLDEISARTSTQYIGDFPNNMPAIVETLKQAEHSVLIATDFVGYGIFSNRQGYEDYQRELSRLHDDEKKKVAIELVTFTATRAEEQRRAQFSRPRTFDRSLVSYRSPEESEALIANLELRYRKPEEPLRGVIQDWQQFYDFLDRAEQDAQRNIAQLATFLQTDKDMPLFLWIIDDKVAIFSVAHLQWKVAETTFKTSDKRLIEQLKIVACSYAGNLPSCPGVPADERGLARWLKDAGASDPSRDTGAPDSSARY